jgi:hypothetical protein
MDVLTNFMSAYAIVLVPLAVLLVLFRPVRDLMRWLLGFCLLFGAGDRN